MKNFLRDLFINILSSTIFQVIATLVSGSGLIILIKSVIDSMKNDVISISIVKLIFMIILCIGITILVIFLIQKLYKHIKKSGEQKEFDDVDDYYFSNYEKHLTIYKNGNGIIIHKFTVVVNNISKFKRIRRKLNIEDGKITSNFPSLEDMLKTKISDRFDKFGFWYYSKDNIILDAKEFYWQKNSPEESKKVKNNPKEIRWIFKINNQHIKENVPYNIIYMISVPGLAPLEDGNLIVT